MSYHVGTRVQLSGYALESSRLYYLGLGEYTRKAQAQAVYEAKRAQRGTITRIDPPPDPLKMNGRTCAVYAVQWDDGHTSECMPYMVQEVQA